MKKLSLILALVLAFTMAIPVQTFGEGVDEGLEKAIKTAKTLFEIPADYKFQSDISNENGKNIYNLSWRSKGNDYSYIMVRISDSGMVSSYESYKPSDSMQQRKLPRISRQEAKVTAEAFIKKVNPDISDEIMYEENNQNTLMDTTYYFSFYRVSHGIPFYNNRVTVYVNRETGEVQTFYANWLEGLSFPDPDKAISLEKAKEAYKSKLGLEPVYRYSYSYEDDQMKLYMVYMPRYENEIYAIDAFTGEKIKTAYGYYGPYYGRGNEKEMLMKAASGAADIVLSPEETGAVVNAKDIKSIEEVEKIARNTKFLELTDEFEMSYSLRASWPIKNDYIYYLSFKKPATEKTEAEYISVRVDAKTGMILRFSKNISIASEINTKYGYEEAKAIVDAFIKENYPELYSQIKYNVVYEENMAEYRDDAKTKSFSFKYDRLANRIAFPDNGISADFDAVNGKISSFDISWFNVDFPAAGNLIPLDLAYDKLFSEIGLELQYKADNTADEPVKIMSGAAKASLPEIKTVYSLKPGKPIYIDAEAGMLLDSQGELYKEQKPVSYSDIKDSFAQKQIMVLAENGVYLEGDQFKPKTEITQLDFFILLSKTLGYYGPALTASSPEKDVDELYAFLERQGIIKAGEVSKGAGVTREDAVKFIIRALKFDKVADMGNIFKGSFSDQKEASEGLWGYISIAAGLKIVSGYYNNFYPKAMLTREAAAVIIYNYLQV